MSIGPENDIAQAMRGEESHGNVAEPDVVLDTRLRGHTNELQNWGSSRDGEEQEG